MNKQKDLLLKKIYDQQKIPLTEKNQRFLNQILKECLVEKKGKDSYRLTPYGEIIFIMGYGVHKQTERLEKKLSTYTPKKTKKVTRLIFVAFATVLVVLLGVLWINLDSFFR